MKYPNQETYHYTYDANYNRSTETVQDGGGIKLMDKTYSYNNRNQLSGLVDTVNSANNVSYTYDANGNQLSKTKGNDTTLFDYDSRNQLRRIRQNGVEQGLYLYDHQGMRISKTENGQQTKYLYDGKSVLQQYHNSADVKSHYFYGNNQLLQLHHVDEGLQYYHLDSLGSVVNLTLDNGSVQARYSYDAFGHTRQQAGSSANSFGFTGHEMDHNTGLIYMKARFYDPDVGRFLNQDSYEGTLDTPPSLHKYLYAYSNPLYYVDPDGHFVWFAVIAYMAYTAGNAAIDTATDVAIDETVNAITGQESTTTTKGVATTFVENFAGDLLTAGVYGKAKKVKKVQKIAEAAQTVYDNSKVAQKLDKAGQVVEDKLAKAKDAVSTRLSKERSSGADNITNKNKNKDNSTQTTENNSRPGSKPATVNNTESAGPMLSNTCCGKSCFVAGTLVLTDSGLKAIEQLNENDLVAAKDEKTGEIEWKSITQFFVYHDREIYALTLENEWGLQETIEVTDNHPFYVQGQGWVDSINLQVGMQIEAFAENRHLTVIALVDQQRTETTYNLEVDEFHTYFVGKMGAWVHNQNANCIQCGGGGTDVLDRIIDNSDNFPEYDIPTPFGYGANSGSSLVETKGGAHGKVKGIEGNESHHMPANSVSPLPINKGPAISMEKADHKQTASWGSSKEAKAYRKEQENLIQQGKFKEAQKMDIDDVQSKFGTKYDNSIKEMEDYTDTLDL